MSNSMSGWTDRGRFFVPVNGLIYWFKKTGTLNQYVTLTHVENLDGNDLPGDNFVYEDLPAPVRRDLKSENLEFVTEQSTLTGVMANGD